MSATFFQMGSALSEEPVEGSAKMLRFPRACPRISFGFYGDSLCPPKFSALSNAFGLQVLLY